MAESHSIEARGSKHSAEQACEFGTNVPSVRKQLIRHAKKRIASFGRAVIAIWPIKSALHLSQAEGCTERAAQYQIDGRAPSAAAILAVNTEMLRNSKT